MYVYIIIWWFFQIHSTEYDGCLHTDMKLLWY